MRLLAWVVQDSIEVPIMTVLTAQDPPTRPEHPGVVLRNVSWKVYEALLAELEGQRLSLTYDRGALEIMPPTSRHEKIGKFIARLVETLTLELRIPIVGLGSATWKSEDIARGLEADECYYIKHAEWAATRDEFDLQTGPPPDLAIEVDITSNTLDKEGIYADLGVPELWRYEGGKLLMRRLLPGKRYEDTARSESLAMLPPDVVESFVARRNTANDTALMIEFQNWVRSNLIKPQK